MVAREDQDVLRVCQVDEVQVLVDGICRAAIPVRTFLACIRRQNEDTALFLIEIPGTAGSQVIVKLERTVLRQYTDLVDAGIGAVTEWKVNDAVLPAERDGRLCNLLRQSAKAASLSASQYHC